MIDLYAELKAIIKALEGADVPYALCGGLALMLYQRPRATLDIDLVLPTDAIEPLSQAVAPLGFTRHPRSMRFDPPGIEILRFYKTDPMSRDVFTLDCLLSNHPATAEAFRNRTEALFEDGSIWVVSPDDLITLKQLRGSPQDLVDIQTIRSRGQQASDPEGVNPDA
jgi:hypothetical protein